MLSRHIAQEFGKEGTTANVVAPGLTETDTKVFLPEPSGPAILEVLNCGFRNDPTTLKLPR